MQNVHKQTRDDHRQLEWSEPSYQIHGASSATFLKTTINLRTPLEQTNHPQQNKQMKNWKTFTRAAIPHTTHTALWILISVYATILDESSTTWNAHNNALLPGWAGAENLGIGKIHPYLGGIDASEDEKKCVGIVRLSSFQRIFPRCQRRRWRRDTDAFCRCTFLLDFIQNEV